jgi:hypothetical protein
MRAKRGGLVVEPAPDRAEKAGLFGRGGRAIAAVLRERQRGGEQYRACANAGEQPASRRSTEAFRNRDGAHGQSI